MLVVKNNFVRTLLSYSMLTILGIGSTFVLDGKVLLWPASVLVLFSNWSNEKRVYHKWYWAVIAITAIIAYLFFKKFLSFGLIPFVFDTIILSVSSFLLKQFLSPIIPKDLKSLYIRIAILFAALFATGHLTNLLLTDTNTLEALDRTQKQLSFSFFLLFAIIPLLLVFKIKLIAEKINIPKLILVFLALMLFFLGYFWVKNLFLTLSSLLFGFYILLLSPIKQGVTSAIISSMGFIIISLFVNIDLPDTIVQDTYLSAIITMMYVALLANWNLMQNTITFLKLEKGKVEDEVKRQVAFYAELNDRLIKETERIATVENELRKSQTLLIESQTIVRMASWDYDFDSETIRWSENAEELIGITPSQLNGLSLQSFLEKVHPDDRTCFSDVLKGLKDKQSFSLEIRLRVNDQYQYFNFSGKKLLDNSGSKRVVGIAADVNEIKLNQLATKEKEELYETLFVSNIDPIAVISLPEKLITDVNPAFERVYGWKKDEIVGKPYLLITAQEIDAMLELDIAFRSGFYRIPARLHQKKNGEEFYVEGSMARINLAEKNLIFLNLKDITARRNAEMQLAEREYKYRLFFKSNLIGMAEVSVYKEWIAFNTRLANILGYKPDELKYLTWDSITHPDDLTYENKLLWELIQRKVKSYTIEKRFIKSDKTTVYCNVSVKAVKSPQGSVTHMVMMVEDISQRKKAEQLLWESQKKLQKAQEIAKLGICRIVQDSSYIELSDEATEILGWNADDRPFYLEQFIQSIPQPYNEMLVNSLKRIQQSIVSEEKLEAAFVRPTGEQIFLSVNLGKIIDPSNHQQDLILTFIDITLSKKAEIALKEANILKDQLFSVIAHDLRGPLGSVNQLLELYITDFEKFEPNSQLEMAGLMSKTLKESLNLLENLLEWARSQRTEPTFEFTNIKKELDETIDFLSSQLNSKGISVNLDIPDSCQVLADKRMLKTIARNLISNAIKYSHAGGSITVQCHFENGNIVLDFIDNGIGMSADTVSRILDERDVFSTPGTSDEKGTGLGLKLVTQFVRKNNGSLEIQSKPGKGTTFRIRFPVPNINRELHTK